MKKTLISLVTVLLVLTVTLIPAFAADAEAATQYAAEDAEASPDASAPAQTAPQEAPPADPTAWQEMLDYLKQNGVDAGSFGEDTVDKMILLGEQFAAMKAEGYTWEERLAQLVTPENILTTASALVLVISTVVLFIMKSRQRTATLLAAKRMQELKDAYDREAEENNALREQVGHLREEQLALGQLLDKVAGAVDENAKSLKTSRDCSLGVAAMVKDVFLNSRSLDHAGKDLMIRNYLKATGESLESDGTEPPTGGEVTA